MAEQPAIAAKTRETDRVNPKCSLRWALDPATGKPVARWILEQPENAASVALRPAA